ncbi:unnamed protein product, partial [Mesorhabditis belari]|uniref:Aminopeptidase N-like N-terminal domain-containing protein n=1 Tax=Mesorhabditis belari TaxID=2138241 RepID=A0AAF3EK29_9BILA
MSLFARDGGFLFLSDFECSPKIFVTWLLVVTVCSFIYALILFLTLNQKDIRREEVPSSLPSINSPNGYSVHLDFKTENTLSSTGFIGTVNISFTPQEETQRLYLHRGANLDLLSYQLFSNGKQISLKKGPYNSESEIQSFIPGQNFSMHSDYYVLIKFNGIFNAEIVEYSYQVNGTNRFGLIFVNDRFSPKGCRYAFPCFDTPNYSANFTMHIRHHYSLKALSNFVVTNTKAMSSDFIEDTFEPIQSIQPGQVSFALTDYPSISSNDDNFKLTVYFNTELLSNVSLSRIKQFMDDSAYQIGKLDVVVIPNHTTSNQPGLSVLNEKETVAESTALLYLQNQISMH